MRQCPKCKTINPKTDEHGFCTMVTYCNEVVKTYLFGLIKIKCKQQLLHELEDEELENNYNFSKTSKNRMEIGSYRWNEDELV